MLRHGAGKEVGEASRWVGSTATAAQKGILCQYKRGVTMFSEVAARTAEERRRYSGRERAADEPGQKKSPPRSA
jgi:hypothetical protein